MLQVNTHCCQAHLFSPDLPFSTQCYCEYAGVALSLLSAFFIGVGVPVLFFAFDETGLALLFTGSALTLVFTSIAFLASVKARDKARGIGAALLLWFYFALIYDGLVLLILFAFSDYPMEKFMLLLSALNPIDLGRIFIMLKMNISALMGYTGALYKDFFGSGTGVFFTLSIMLLWITLPLLWAIRVFKRKDLESIIISNPGTNRILQSPHCICFRKV